VRQFHDYIHVKSFIIMGIAMGEAMMNKANMVAMFKTAKAVVTDVLTAPVNSAVAIYKDCRAEKRSQLLSVWAPVAVQSHFALPVWLAIWQLDQ
jgi:hypothetical protein